MNIPNDWRSLAVSEERRLRLLRMLRPSLGLVAAAWGALAAGCATPAASVASPPVAQSIPAESRVATTIQVLREGDTIGIVFPNVPSMNVNQQIRQDGFISLALVGEVAASGKTPAELEQEISRLYSRELTSPEVTITVVSAAFDFYVSGEVRQTGKFVASRRLTALEAVMEAGGFNPETADTRRVVVIRNGGRDRFTLDLQAILDGQSTEPFYLERSDIVNVPKRFQIL